MKRNIISISTGAAFPRVLLAMANQLSVAVAVHPVSNPDVYAYPAVDCAPKQKAQWKREQKGRRAC